MKHPDNKYERLLQGNIKAKEVFKTYYSSHSKEDLPGHFGVLRKTRKLCSNPYCCGNSRRTPHRHRLTIQEIKQRNKEISEMEGLFNGMENNTFL